MSAALPPRAVVVTRPTEYEEILARHGTRAMAAFFLQSRGRSIDEVEAAHRVVRSAVDAVQPFEDAVRRGAGRPSPGLAGEMMVFASHGKGQFEERALVEATTADGQRLVALNEIFVGHRAHQSARYRLKVGDATERQSSSGIVIATGTGATGWARSIHRQRRCDVPLPGACARCLVFFVREAFPSVLTGTSIAEGTLSPETSLWIGSEMNEGGVVFGDGIEEDRIDFHFGVELTARTAKDALRLLVG